MQIISTNISQPKTVLWRGRNILTGIYKKPVEEPIYLGKEDVENDAVIDRKHHGGTCKACYLFGADYYDDWQALYPKLNWEWGMFGENLTVAGLDETKLYVGAVYRLGEAVVQITEPRQPCYKLGIRFGTQDVLTKFLEYSHSGTYVRILEEGKVAKGDVFKLEDNGPNNFTIAQYNILINQKIKDKELIQLAITNDSIPEIKRNSLKKHI